MDGNKESQAAEPIGNVAVLAGHLHGMSVSEGMKTLERWPRDDVSITIRLEEPSNKKLPPAAPYRKEERYRLEPIPEWVRKVNEDAYAPRYITIGPMHRGEDDNPLRRQDLKKHYLERLKKLNEDELIKGDDVLAGLFQPFNKEACLKALEKKESDTRRFYGQDFGETINKEWSEMLLLDGCFVVTHLLEFNDLMTIKTSTHTKWVWAVLKIDLILLENQLPFSVLECIMSFLLNNEVNVSNFLRRMVINYWVYRGRDDHDVGVVDQLLKNEEFTKVNHLVHLIHLAHYLMIYGDKKNKGRGCGIVCHLTKLCMWKTRSCICYFPILAMQLLTLLFMLLFKVTDPEEEEEKRNKEDEEKRSKEDRKKDEEKRNKEDRKKDEEAAEDDDEDEDEKNIPSATEVYDLGIDFRKKYLWVPKSKYDVCINAFHNNIVDIPQLMVSSSEEPLLHNLIAWEHAGVEYDNVEGNQKEKGTKKKEKGDYVEQGHFTKYAFLMYNLINKPDDIALLQQKGILLNKLGTDEEVVSYFKKLVQWNSRPKTTPSSETRLEKVKNFLCPEKRSKIDQVMEVLKHRVEQPEYRYWAEVKKYFSSPLQILLVATSVVMFVSTLVPAILSVHTTK